MAMRQLLSLLAKVGAVLLVTLLLLEGLAQAVWWQRDCVVLSEKELCLLPYPILSESHLEILSNLEAAEREGSNYDQFDPILGWSVRPGSSTVKDGTPYESNEIGVRARRSYTQIPPPGITRLAVFGPSFARADDVDLEDAWTYLMEQSWPDLEVMNWGVSGYGTDQAYLRYQTQGAAYSPDIVIMVYEEENLRRNVNRYRPFFFPRTGIPLTKPVFVPKDEGLALLDNPFQSLTALRDTAVHAPNRFLDTVCPHDFFCVREQYEVWPLDVLKSYRFLRTLAFQVKYRDSLPVLTTWQDSYDDPLQTQVTLRLIRMFAETARQNGSVPVVVFFAYRGTIDLYAAGEIPMYHQLVHQIQAEGIYTLDLTPCFVEANGQSTDFTPFFAPGGHYNETGNRVVSDAVIDYLCQEGILSQCASSQ